MPRKIKVAHIITQLEFGGAQQNTLHTVAHLDRQRFEPHLVCGPGAYLDSATETADYPTHFIASLVRPVRPAKDFGAYRELTAKLKELKPDIVHTHSSKAGIIGRFAASAADVPVIIHTFHGFGFHREQSIATRQFYVFLEKLAARKTHHFISVSSETQKQALALGIGRREAHSVIRSGVPLSLYRSITRRPNQPEGIPVGPENKLVTTVGPFKPQKNLMDFLLAAKAVYARHPEARFLIIGDGELRPWLEKFVFENNLDRIIFMPGWRRDMPHILMRTDVFVMTSLWEGLPRSLVEAMAAGLPCVANAIDGVKDILHNGKNGFATEPKNWRETAERIFYLLENPAEAMKYGQEARASIGDEFDIDNMVRMQEKLYEELVKKHKIIL